LICGNVFLEKLQGIYFVLADFFHKKLSDGLAFFLNICGTKLVFYFLYPQHP